MLVLVDIIFFLYSCWLFLIFGVDDRYIIES